MTKRLGGSGGAAEVMRAARGLFDGAYYLERAPDVAEAGVDPFDHFMTFGCAKGGTRAPASISPTI